MTFLIRCLILSIIVIIFVTFIPEQNLLLARTFINSDGEPVVTDLKEALPDCQGYFLQEEAGKTCRSVYKATSTSGGTFCQQVSVNIAPMKKCTPASSQTSTSGSNTTSGTGSTSTGAGSGGVSAIAQKVYSAPTPLNSILQSIFGADKAYDKFGTLGGFISQLATVAFAFAGLLMFYWLAWGIFQYIFAGGKKEDLAKARARITWAIVGFLLLSISFAVAQYVEQIFPAKIGAVQKVSSPDKLDTSNLLDKSVIKNKDGSDSICTRQIISDCEAANSKCAIVSGKAQCVKK